MKRIITFFFFRIKKAQLVLNFLIEAAVVRRREQHTEGGE